MSKILEKPLVEVESEFPFMKKIIRNVYSADLNLKSMKTSLWKMFVQSLIFNKGGLNQLNEFGLIDKI